jgi:hypothetical protein
LNFDGTTNTTTIPHHGLFNLATNFEIQCWFKMAAADKPAANTFRTLTSKEIDFNNRNWWIAIRSEGTVWWKSSANIDLTNATDLADGGWHLVSAVHDGTAARLYVDGELVATDAAPGSASTQTSTVYFGAETGNTRFFKGPQDEFRFSNVRRSSNWVWAVYRNIAANGAFSSYSSVPPNNLVGVPPPDLSALQLNGAGLHFQIAGATGYNYTVQASTNLANPAGWTNLLVTNSPTLPFNWTDTNASNFLKRFYRVLLGP